MLSYLHAFHAGNHADILKHLTLFTVLRYFNEKGKPYSYFDTHAGSGLYPLNSSYAQKNQEFKTGIEPLLQAPHRPKLLEDFCQALQSALPKEHYWGSPYLALKVAQADTKLRLFEQHPTVLQELQRHIRATPPRRLKIMAQDGHQGLVASLPPEPRRAVILIDPSYEQKQEYQQVLNTLKEATKRFETGCYLLWYPLLQRPEPLQMLDRLKRTFLNHTHLELKVREPHEDFGMHGSGMFIINPPYTLVSEMAESMVFLSELLREH
ncbi:MAG: 23S rRNA (adenine(2030)-N(6))-methyltransferase RlmJ [Cardiobacteriaceae bacterium]|nr:23S rRNA (adenine(2030)-N(6))-methyltransferase RlmJ [Cardiobacteriaceae bacterium]